MSKKILYVASSTEHIDRFHRDYIAALRGLGHSITVMASGTGADIDIPFEKKIFSLKNLKNIVKIRRILRRDRYDAILLNTTLAAVLVRLACPHRRPCIVNLVHGYLFSENVSPQRSRIFFLAERLLRRKTDSIITMNEEDFRSAREHRLCLGRVYKIPGMGAKIRTRVTNFENIRAEYASEGSFVMCFVGELSRRKNQEMLIRALPALCDELPGVALWLVGDGAERKHLGELSRELGVADKVLFLGKREDACDFMRAADLYVSAAGVEGLPHNVLEAMGIGKTVLATDIKGHRDLIENGVSGFLYEYNNIDDFVNKTCQIYDKTLEIDESKPKDRYEKFSKHNVFDSVFFTLCTALELSERKMKISPAEAAEGKV